MRTQAYLHYIGIQIWTVTHWQWHSNSICVFLSHVPFVQLLLLIIILVYTYEAEDNDATRSRTFNMVIIRDDTPYKHTYEAVYTSCAKILLLILIIIMII